MTRPDAKAPRDQRRRASRDRQSTTPSPGTSGGFWGLSGEDKRSLLIGWLTGSAFVWVVTTINIFSTVDDAGIEPIWPAIWEYSSAVSTMIAMSVIWAAVRWSMLRRRSWPQLAGAHLAGLLTYSVLHVLIFVGLREAAYAVLGGEYAFGFPERFLYELRKDLLGYGVLATVFWIVVRLRRQPIAVPVSSTFDILDGSRLVRVEINDILAITAAGNYAEFILADGRRPMMRTSLAALEQKLAPAGFARTHRSWLVNPARVTGLRPDGSGDYTIEMGATQAPLSRRFPEATARLRRR